MENYSYLHLGEPADPDRYVICKYRVSTDLPMEKAAPEAEGRGGMESGFDPDGAHGPGDGAP